MFIVTFELCVKATSQKYAWVWEFWPLSFDNRVIVITCTKAKQKEPQSILGSILFVFRRPQRKRKLHAVVNEDKVASFWDIYFEPLVCNTVATEAVASSFYPVLHLAFCLVNTRLIYLLGVFVCFVVRSTQACSMRSSGPASRTVCLWMKNCCLSWWRRRAMPHTWWASGTWACTRRTACPHGGDLTHTLVYFAKREIFDVPMLYSRIHFLTLLTVCSRLPDRQRGLLLSYPLRSHPASEPDSLCVGPAGRRGCCHGIQRSLFHWAAQPEGYQHHCKTQLYQGFTPKHSTHTFTIWNRIHIVI